MFLILLLSTIILGILFVKKKYFTLHGPIPGIPPHFLFGNLIHMGMIFHGLSSSQALAKLKKQFGDVFQFWFGSQHYIAVNNISDIQHIFSHRQIYDHSDFLFKQLSILFPDGMGSCRGW